MTIKCLGRLWQRNRLVQRLFLILLWAMSVCGFNWGFQNDCTKAGKILADSPTGITDELAKRILALCPDGAAGHMAKGLQLERKGAIDKAIEEYRQANAADPSLSQAHGNLGLLLLERGSYDEAGTELTKALMAKPDPRYHRGLALLLNDGKETALLLYHSREALKGDPDDPTVHTWLADAYFKRGVLDMAAQEYSKVLDKESDNEHARLGLAEAYQNNGRLDDAIREFATAALANPSNSGIHKKLAGLYRQKGNNTLAEKELLLAGLNPDDADLEMLIKQGDQLLLARSYDKAIEAYEAIVKKRPESPVALEKLGDAQMAAGLDDDAIKVYRKAVSLDQSNVSLHYSLGILYERKGLLVEAEAEYRKSLQHDPKNGDARRRLADIYTLRGNFAQSIEEYTELIKLRGNNPILHFRLARVYEKYKDYKKAIDEYLAAVRLAPDNLEAKKELAALYIKRGMVGEAEGQYLEILRLDRENLEIRSALMSSYVNRKNYDGLLLLLKEDVDKKPGDANNHYRLGILYDYNKEYDSATAEYQKSIELNGNHAKALNALGKLYIKTGNIEKAKGMLEAARVADPNFIEPRELLHNIREDQIMRPIKHRTSSHKAKTKKKSGKAKKRTNKKRQKN